jgi:DNA-binding NarL/FixJ family response regulator
MPSLSLVIAAANSRLRDGLKALTALGDFHIVGEAGNSTEAVQLVLNRQPQALIVEDRLVMNDVSVIEKCRLSCPLLKVVVLEGAAGHVHTFGSVDALVHSTSSMGALARTIASLFPQEV